MPRGRGLDSRLCGLLQPVWCAGPLGRFAGASGGGALRLRGKPDPAGRTGDIVQRQPGEVYLLRAEYGGRFLVRVRTSGEVAVPYSVELFAPVFVR
ncbi:hypothetical protein ACN28S_27710 [Cystobacter fuscus]